MRGLLVIGAVLAMLCAAGCGGKDEPSAETTAPFARAVEQYLHEKSMGMKVSSFKSLEVSGGTATAEVRMADKDVGYGLRPQWTFTFQRAGGAWKVTNVER